MGNVTDKTHNEVTFMMQQAEKLFKEQFLNKNIAYGDSFGKQFQKYGPISALVRLSDKFSRAEALILGAKNEVLDESLEDTLGDMATYCMMTLYELKRWKEQNNGYQQLTSNHCSSQYP
jgi:hypothetical protein